MVERKPEDLGVLGKCFPKTYTLGPIRIGVCVWWLFRLLSELVFPLSPREFSFLSGMSKKDRNSFNRRQAIPRGQCPPTGKAER